MKIQCLREQHLLDGVTVLTLSTADVGLHEVLERHFVEVSHQPDESVPDVGEAPLDNLNAPQRFRYRVGEAADGDLVEANGMLVGSGGASMLSFLERRYVPDADSDRLVDRLLLQLRSGDISRTDWLRVMEEQVFRDPSEPSYRRFMYEQDRPPCPPFILYRQQLTSDFNEGQDSRGPFLVRSVGADVALAVVAPYVDRVGGFAIPRWRFAILGEYDAGFAGWDGRRYHLAEQYPGLPESLRHALERDGRVVQQPVGWFVPVPDLSAELLVRVPYAREVADIIDVGPPPRDASLRRPCFMIDSRRPLALRDRPELELLDDPKLALSLLARRTTRGCYVPAMPAAPVNDLALSPDGEPARYVVGCWPR